VLYIHHVTMRNTKIICTIGPETNSEKKLSAMYEAGMNAVRLNMTHGDHASHLKIIKSVTKLNETVKYPVAIILDTQGPEVRTGTLQKDINLKKGDVITVSVRGGNVEESSVLHIDYKDLINTVNEGDTITVDNGLINLRVLKKNQGLLKCKILDGGTLKSKRHVNLPGIKIALPAITNKDKKDILFGIKNGVDYIALSFARKAKDIKQLKKFLGKNANKIKVISKIEDQEGVRNIEEIIDVSDAIMVARGDLGIEINIEELPNVQRNIVRLCQEKGKRVIVATHMLESMIQNPIPTRAEVTDVANAIYEEVDAVMLSAETSIGKYPVSSIRHIDKIARASEKQPGLSFRKNLIKTNEKQHIAATAVGLAEAINSRAVVVITKGGIMAQYVTNRRPVKTYIYAFTENKTVQRQLALNRSVAAHLIKFNKEPELTIKKAVDALKKEGFKVGERVVVVSDIITLTNSDSIQIRAVD